LLPWDTFADLLLESFTAANLRVLPFRLQRFASAYPAAVFFDGTPGEYGGVRGGNLVTAQSKSNQNGMRLA
jgi:hypothetical protein